VLNKYFKDDGTLALVKPEDRFYHDTKDPKHWASMLVTHPTSAQWDPVNHEAWREIPVTYLVSEKDEALPAAVQRMMIGRLEAEGIEVTQESCDASHSPFLSMPDKLAEITLRVASS
jgi:hypothetical protein